MPIGGPPRTSRTAVPYSQGALAQHGEVPTGSHNGEFLPWPLVEHESERDSVDVPDIIGNVNSTKAAASSPPFQAGVPLVLKQPWQAK